MDSANKNNKAAAIFLISVNPSGIANNMRCSKWVSPFEYMSEFEMYSQYDRIF